MNVILEQIKNVLENDISVKEVTYIPIVEESFSGTVCRFYGDANKVSDKTVADILEFGKTNDFELEVQRCKKKEPYVMLAIHNMLIEKV